MKYEIDIKRHLTDPLLEMDTYATLLGQLEGPGSHVRISGVADSQRFHLAYSLCCHTGRRGIFIASDSLQARFAYKDLLFLAGDRTLLIPPRDVMLHDIEARSHDAVFERVAALDRVVRGDYGFAVASVDALAFKLMPPLEFEGLRLDLSDGQVINPEELHRKLTYMGYERVDFVEGKGQFAARGGIIDIFAVDDANPYRIEFFGDEIDSVRRFDVISQRSVEKINGITVLPARDLVFHRDKGHRIASAILEQQSHVAGLHGAGIRRDAEYFTDGRYFAGIDRYVPYIIDEPCTLFDYVPDSEPLVFIDEPEKTSHHLDNMIDEHVRLCSVLAENGMMPVNGSDTYFDYISIAASLENSGLRSIEISEHAFGGDILPRRCDIGITVKSNIQWHGVNERFKDDLKSWKKAGRRVLILADSALKASGLSAAFASENIETAFVEDPKSPPVPGQVIVAPGMMRSGFEYPDIGFVIVCLTDMAAGKANRIKPATKKYKGLAIYSFYDLAPGDFVVHHFHGIGQYTGMQQLVVDNVRKDYLRIRYLNGDFLYIPSTQLDSIQKYIGSEGRAPRLNRLGSSDWGKTKRKVSESLRKLAVELLKLYAQRQELRGFAFSKDTVWQAELEEGFAYEETEDQLKCIEEIKSDMESDRPMDRLLCGDVGYGKTEVAIRAVFKAVMDGRQVAYLVPTTVLAQQHYLTFVQRMKDFPVTVDVISRFRSRVEQKRILAELKCGNIDVLIGTHRLLQKDIEFQKLGLLVVDEEQRFGVIHKEKIKNLSPNIDVLTLTATPIPRTLHMSMIGIRDISSLEDPPENRFPVQTYVMEYRSDVIRDAIIRELAREGQVFYLFNRVRSIDVKAYQLQQMVPEARIAAAHGQMEEHQLEDIMMKFINKEYDVLVCTTIIESGLDMPNVNTIIVEDADTLGLAQLYQLRGRVGRSDRQAYAYITHKREKSVSEIAEKRLKAIRDFTEFGSGFRIAMRDLEIRGAGNLLGPEQHGHIESVGYEMYYRLLGKAIKDLKGTNTVRADEPVETTIDLKTDAYISDVYIPAENQKIAMYKRIATLSDESDAADIRDELLDRYGDIPASVDSLINIALIKSLAKYCGVTSIIERGGSVTLRLDTSKLPDNETVSKLSAKYRKRLMFNAGMSPYILVKTGGSDTAGITVFIKILLQDFKSFEVS